MVRGEDVVSLGWCFWHKGCFGCLLCGTGLNPPLDDQKCQEELQRIDNDPNGSAEIDYGYIDWPGWGRNHRRRGVELQSIPLCSLCENATEGLYKRKTLGMGLTNVARNDGGLSSSRLDIVRKKGSKDKAQLPQKAKALTGGQRQDESSKHEPEDMANHLADTADIGMGKYDNTGGLPNCCCAAECLSSITDPIYVSVLDTIGGPSFQPSRTKPLPRWMALLPSNRQQKLKPNSTISSSPDIRNTMHDHNEHPDTCSTLSTTTITPNPSSFIPEKNGIRHNTPETTASSNTEDAEAIESVMFRNRQVKISNSRTSSDYRGPGSQQSATPYPSNRNVYRTHLSLNIPKSLLPGPATAITMEALPRAIDGGPFSALPSQAATSLFSKDGRKLKKIGAFSEALPIAERFTRQNTNLPSKVGKGKNTNDEESHQIVEADHIDRRDELRRELIRLFN